MKKQEPPKEKSKWIPDPWNKKLNLVTMYPVKSRWLEKY